MINLSNCRGDMFMENVLRVLEEMKTVILTYNDKLEKIEKRLERLEKVDSIEHRVAVNQIDLTDIKEVLEGMKDHYSFSTNDEIKTIHKRLDSHLIKIGRMEEEVISMKKQEAVTK
jgi:endonuclease III-like uncharacterized protein